MLRSIVRARRINNENTNTFNKSNIFDTFNKSNIFDTFSKSNIFDTFNKFCWLAALMRLALTIDQSILTTVIMYILLVWCLDQSWGPGASIIETLTLSINPIFLTLLINPIFLTLNYGVNIFIHAHSIRALHSHDGSKHNAIKIYIIIVVIML